jgi:hypothetical protein
MITARSGNNLSDTLCIICGQAQENNNSQSTDNHLKHCATHKDVDYAGNDDSDQSHEHELPNARQVFLSEVTIETHSAEKHSRPHECAHDATHLKYCKDSSETQAHQCRETMQQ